MKIVTIENNPELLNLITDTTRQHGYEITVCDSVVEAWQFYQQTVYPFLLIDLDFTGSVGLELCRKIKSLPQGNHVIILVMVEPAQLAGDGSFSSMIEAGVDDILIKPLHPQLLSMRLELTKRRYETERKLWESEEKFRIFGYDRLEMLGQSIEMLLPEQLRAIHLDHRQYFLAHPQHRLMGQSLDLVGQRKNGTDFPIEVGLSVVHTRNGVLVICHVIDIIKRWEAEAISSQF